MAVTNQTIADFAVKSIEDMGPVIAQNERLMVQLGATHKDLALMKLAFIKSIFDLAFNEIPKEFRAIVDKDLEEIQSLVMKVGEKKMAEVNAMIDQMEKPELNVIEISSIDDLTKLIGSLLGEEQ